MNRKGDNSNYRNRVLTIGSVIIYRLVNPVVKIHIVSPRPMRQLRGINGCKVAHGFISLRVPFLHELFKGKADCLRFSV